VITPVITTNLFATYTTNDATGIGNNNSAPSQNTLTTGAGLNWQLLRWLAMRLQYTYTQYGRGGNSSNGTSSFNGTNGTGNTSVNQASVGFFSSF
jgi:opacity protein-like surface antigen